MNQNKTESYHWENPRICATCIHYQQNRCNLTAFHFPAEHPACPTDAAAPSSTSQMEISRTASTQSPQTKHNPCKQNQP